MKKIVLFLTILLAATSAFACDDHDSLEHQAHQSQTFTQGEIYFTGDFEDSDTNKDGKVDRHEYQGVFMEFMVLDKNRDRYITKDEAIKLTE